MDPERHQQLTSLLDEALRRAPDERDAFLAGACGDDNELRREVESLIAVLEQSPDFIEVPAFAGPEGQLPDQSADEPTLAGQRIGAYRIVSELGQGGMGAVWLAERADEQFREQVALKIVKRGMDTDFVLRRFRHERQILASLHHPNIAQLFDGGTTGDGLPYFVMEYIEGEPIDRYCDHHQLSTIDRLKLFRTVCGAVHYAHQNLVIHRDIKPANIIITADGTPKLLDFGIAKILNPEISQTLEKTATLLRLMTPEYASPEQVRGKPITTATDIYSLGVVLYELLTGHRPYLIRSILPSDIERVICEQEPTRPSTAVTRSEERLTAEGGSIRITPDQVSQARNEGIERLSRKLAGDLDNIVLMALRKEPQRRYASVEHLSEDLRRHLEGLPVTARPATFAYRAGKFVQRHKAGVAAAVLVVLSLIAGLITTVWQARRATAAQARAERRFNDVRRLANAYLFEFHDAIENLQGSTAARELVVRRALEYLDSLALEAGDDPALQQELSAAYVKVGDVQGRPGFPNLGKRSEAIESYGKAIDIGESLLAAGWRSADFRREMAINYDRLGDTQRTMGDSTGALESYRRSLALREQLASEKASNLAGRRDLATSYQRIGDMLALTGEADSAMEHQRRALPLFEAVVEAEPDNARARRELFIGCVKLGDRLLGAADAAGALARYQQALAIAASIAAADAQNARAQRELAICHDKVGNARAAQAQTAEALMSYQTAMEIRRRLVVDARNAEARRDLSISYDKIGGMLAASGRTDEAINSYRQALAIDTALAKTDPDNAQNKLDRASSLEKIGLLLVHKGDLYNALDRHEQARTLREQVAASDRANVDALRDLASSFINLGEVSAALAARDAGRQPSWFAAKQWYQRGLDLLLELQNRDASGQADAAVIERVRAAIAKCDAALK